MSLPTITELEDLGRKIYEEIGVITQQPDVHVEGQESPKQKRLKELNQAAKWNAFALSQVRKDTPI